MSGRGLQFFWRRWRRDRRGVAAIEFAMLMPVLLLMYLGGFETSEAVSTYRKVADTTVELANVAAQYTTMSSADVSTVMNASSQIMTPCSTSNLSIVLSEITIDANNNATVTWSQTYNGGAGLTPGSNFSMPSGMSTASTSFILVQTKYLYVPSIGTQFISSIPMSDQIFMLPRQSGSISYTG